MFQTYATYVQPVRLVLSVSLATPLVGPYRYAKNGAISTPLKAALSCYPVTAIAGYGPVPIPLSNKAILTPLSVPLCVIHVLSFVVVTENKT